MPTDNAWLALGPDSAKLERGAEADRDAALFGDGCDHSVGPMLLVPGQRMVTWIDGQRREMGPPYPLFPEREEASRGD